MTSQAVPPALRELFALAGEWALATERARREKRATSTMAEIESYYASLRPHMPAIASFLDQCSVQVPEPEQRTLSQLAFMFLETAVAVEFYRQPELPNGFPRERFDIAEL
jgi:hypothetical protein